METLNSDIPQMESIDPNNSVAQPIVTPTKHAESGIKSIEKPVRSSHPVVILQKLCSEHKLSLKFNKINDRKSNEPVTRRLVISKSGVNQILEFVAYGTSLKKAEKNAAIKALGTNLIQEFRKAVIASLENDSNSLFEWTNYVNTVSLIEYWSIAELFNLNFSIHGSNMSTGLYCITICSGSKKYTGEPYQCELDAIYSTYIKIDFNDFLSQLNIYEESTHVQSDHPKRLDQLNRLCEKTEKHLEYFFLNAPETNFRTESKKGPFLCKCQFDQHYTFALGNTKKSTMNEAAYAMLKLLNVLLEKTPEEKRREFEEKCNQVTLPTVLPLDNKKMTQSIRLVNMLSEKYYNIRSINKIERIQRKIDGVSHSLISSIRQIFPNAKLELYGSTVNGFGEIDSDLDFVLSFSDDPYEQEISRAEQIKIIRRIFYRAFRKNKCVRNLVPILRARVPILELEHITSSREFFKCDISVANTLPLYNSRLLRFYCDIDERLPRLGMLIKEFAKTAQIYDAKHGGLKSYALNIMLIYFLQQCKPPVLPVLHELESDQQRPITVHDCEVKFFSDLDRLHQVWPDYRKNTRNDGQLFLDFFIFYSSTFNFETDVITIRQAGKLTKAELEWKSEFAIQDPFLLCKNLANNVKLPMFKLVRSSLIRTRNLYTNQMKDIKFSKKKLKTLSHILFDKYVLKDMELMKLLEIGCSHCFLLNHKTEKCPVLSNKNQQ